MHAYWLLFVWVLIKVTGNWLIKAKITAQESSHISRAYLLPFCLLHAWFLSDSHVFLGSSFFHTLGKAPCMTCRRWLRWKAWVKQCSLKWTEHITNLVPGMRLKLFLLVLTNRSHTSLVLADGLCKPIATNQLEWLLQSWTKQRLATIDYTVKCIQQLLQERRNKVRTV